MSFNLTNKERQFAINQLRCLDYLKNSRFVPIPPKHCGEPERWVAVKPFSHGIRTNIRQPDPERAVLCGSHSKYGHIDYYYGDDLSCYIISSIIFTVILSVITTPLLLLCCIPAIKNLVKVRTPFNLSNMHQLCYYRLAEILMMMILQEHEKSVTSGCAAFMEH